MSLTLRHSPVSCLLIVKTEMAFADSDAYRAGPNQRARSRVKEVACLREQQTTCADDLAVQSAPGQQGQASLSDCRPSPPAAESLEKEAGALRSLEAECKMLVTVCTVTRRPAHRRVSSTRSRRCVVDLEIRTLSDLGIHDLGTLGGGDCLKRQFSVMETEGLAKEMTLQEPGSWATFCDEVSKWIPCCRMGITDSVISQLLSRLVTSKS